MRFIFFQLLVIVFFSSCVKEEKLLPSDYEKNYFDLSYLEGNTDPLMQAIYSFWKETGIAVFCDDTIGYDERIDEFGHVYEYYETLSLNYSLGDISGSSYPEVLSVTEIPPGEGDAVIFALDFIKNELLPLMQVDGATYRSLYLVDDLSVFGAGSYMFKGLNCVVLSKISRLKDMDAAERIAYVGEVAKVILTSILLESERYDAQISKFEMVTRNMETTGAFVHFYTTYYYTWNIPRYSVGKDLYDVGFLGEDPNYASCCPANIKTDIELYINEIFVLQTQEAFQEKWGIYPRIMAKYDILREILDELLL